MQQTRKSPRTGWWSLVPLAVVLLTQIGCVTYAKHAVPANRLSGVLLGPSRDATVPINLAHLRQEPVADYLVGPGDTLGIYVQGVIPPQIDEIPSIAVSQGTLTNNYYPPAGHINSPTVGVPLTVGSQGTLTLPLVGTVRVGGLTLEQVATAIRDAYLAQNVIQTGRERILATLVRPRTYRVLVLREDAGTDVPQMIRKDSVVFAKRGRGDVVDLPAFENDVLHALTATGGLPGIDCVNQVWILRSRAVGPAMIDAAQKDLEAAGDLARVIERVRTEATETKIPLRLFPDEPLPFGPQDIILEDGDIVYLEPRVADVFYTGGLLPGGQVPLPRDHALDVVEAVALAQGSIGGPGGLSSAAVFRTGAGPGNVIPPTRVLILRKLPNGQQLPIRVDLARAMHDQKERILIQPGDFVMLHYKPGEVAGNVALNFFNFNVLLNPSDL